MFRKAFLLFLREAFFFGIFLVFLGTLVALFPGNRKSVDLIAYQDSLQPSLALASNVVNLEPAFSGQGRTGMTLREFYIGMALAGQARPDRAIEMADEVIRLK